VQEYLIQVAADCILLAGTQVIQLLYEVISVNLLPLFCLNECSRCLGPRKEIFLIKSAVRHTIASYGLEMNDDITNWFLHALLRLNSTNRIGIRCIRIQQYWN